MFHECLRKVRLDILFVDAEEELIGYCAIGNAFFLYACPLLAKSFRISGHDAF